MLNLTFISYGQSKSHLCETPGPLDWFVRGWPVYRLMYDVITLIYIDK